MSPQPHVAALMDVIREEVWQLVQLMMTLRPAKAPLVTYAEALRTPAPAVGYLSCPSTLQTVLSFYSGPPQSLLFPSLGELCPGFPHMYQMAIDYRGFRSAELEAVRALFSAKEKELSVAACQGGGAHPAAGGTAAKLERCQRQCRSHICHKWNGQGTTRDAYASGPPPPLLLAANVAAVEPRPRSDPKYQTLPYNTKFRPAPPLQPPPPPPPLPPPNRQPESLPFRHSLCAPFVIILGSAAATEENSPPDQKKAKEADSALVDLAAISKILALFCLDEVQNSLLRNSELPPNLCLRPTALDLFNDGGFLLRLEPTRKLCTLRSRSEPRSVAMDGAPPSPPESSDSEEEKEETRNAPDRDQEQVKEDQQPQQHTVSGEGSASETDGSQSQPVALPEPQQRPARGNLRSSGSTGGNGGRRKKGPQRVSFDPLALLLDAALEGELDLVRTTAAQVPNPSAANDEGITALHNAICAGHLDIVKFLVEFGCDVNAQDSDGWTPLHCAASCNNLAMVRFLVEHGACVFAATLSDHETAADKCEEDEEGFDSCSEYLYGVQEKLGVINGGVAYAVFDYEARQPDELTFGQGDMVQILRRGGAEGDTEQPCGWWWARLRDGREGYLPRNLLGLYPRVQPCRPSPEE
ncbi:hypothetical protein HPB51_015219 [Rhipicephalus microplus]|uniref:SH3 domain-containing protein n=1 Tax=Rhipicephalus microplus TaxID=6941 RepID=A0A9J6EAG2_RHIMP|nr:hypothetical protein HPB51_015219 [Rhipicephalus microplus]